MIEKYQFQTRGSQGEAGASGGARAGGAPIMINIIMIMTILNDKHENHVQTNDIIMNNKGAGGQTINMITIITTSECLKQIQ